MTEIHGGQDLYINVYFISRVYGPTLLSEELTNYLLYIILFIRTHLTYLGVMIIR